MRVDIDRTISKQSYFVYLIQLKVTKMETLEIELTNQKALKLLQDMEELQLIRVIRKKTKLSSLRGQLKSPMSNLQIDDQLNRIRNEWEKDI